MWDCWLVWCPDSLTECNEAGPVGAENIANCCNWCYLRLLAGAVVAKKQWWYSQQPETDLEKRRENTGSICILQDLMVKLDRGLTGKAKMSSAGSWCQRHRIKKGRLGLELWNNHTHLFDFLPSNVLIILELSNERLKETLIYKPL